MSGLYRFGRSEVRPLERLLLIDGQPASIGARAFDLLLVLIERRERVVSKNELLDLVWAGLVVEENNLQVHVSALRKLLGPNAIATIPGRGYRFALPLENVLSVSSPAAVPDTRALHDGQDSLTTNLPAELAPLYGRDAEVDGVLRLVEQHRLVSIVGPGGIGKTRMAQAVAHRLRGGHKEGVWLIELAALSDPAQVAGAVAQILKAPVSSVGHEFEAAVAALRDKSLTLVLDNCEHLLDAAGRLAAAIRRAAPSTTIVVTSQEPLNIADEQVYRLGTLAVPPPDALISAQEAIDYGAVALFVARVRAIDPRFELSARNVNVVLDICRRLDGIPLALELAAARVSLLGAEGVRARLDQRFELLTGGARKVPRKHQTLRAALEWSYALLSDAERVVFRRLGVCVGGFSIEAAQEVAHDATISDWEVLDSLGGLVDKSLVTVDPTDPPRYRLLETARAYALERLEEAGETQTTTRRHAQVFLALFEASWAEQWQVRPTDHLARYRPDLENLRAAISWSSNNDHELEVALAGAAGWLWFECGLIAEGIYACNGALLHVNVATSPASEARLMSELAQLGRLSIPVDTADRALDRALALYRGMNDAAGQYLVLSRRASFFAAAGDDDGARSVLEELASLEKPAWPPRLRLQRIVAKCSVLGFVGPVEDFRAAQEERLHLARVAASEHDEMFARANLLRATVILGQFDDAIRDGRELAERCRRRQLPAHLGHVLFYLATALTLSDRIEEAVGALREAAPTLCLWALLPRGFDLHALIALLRGRKENAAILFGAGCATYKRLGHKRQIGLSSLHDDVLGRLRQVCAPELLSHLMREGETMSERDAIALALRELESADG